LNINNNFKEYTLVNKFNYNNNINWVHEIKTQKLFDTSINYDLIDYLIKLVKVLTNKSYIYKIFDLVDINFIFSIIIQSNLTYLLSINLLLTSYFFYFPFLNYNLIGLKGNINFFSLSTLKNFFSLITFIILSCICYTFTNDNYTILNSIIIILLHLSLHISNFGFKIFI
jgi:hypothetical protein